MTLRIGILGAARVATYGLIGAAQAVDAVSAHAVAARDPARARAYAARHAIPVVYPDYQSLIEAPDVDAVYVALPPNLHARWSIAAVEAGKPVLCEKPFALSTGDVDAMLAAEARSGTLIMEAQHSHYHPINIRARDIMRSGVLGAVRTIDGAFTATVPEEPGEIRWDGAVGGGALWDLGVYPAYWLRSYMGDEPVVEHATHQVHSSGADIATSASLRFPCGATATLRTSMIAPVDAHVMVVGERGTMRVSNPLSASHPQSITLSIDGRDSEEYFTTRASYAYQLEVFRDAVRDGAQVPTRGEDSLATIRLLSAICDAAREAAHKEG